MEIYTSIAPRNLGRQWRAIESWVKQGFNPVSLNSPEEVDQLRDEFPQVRFEVVERNAIDFVGKPFVFVDDLFAAIRGGEGQVAGIVNSDIIFDTLVELPEFFADQASGGIVFGSRLDVDSPESSSGTVYDIGFDYFFMDRETAACYPESRLSMGAPMWDYWAVLMPIIGRRQVRVVNSVIAKHVRHEQTWSNELNVRMLGEVLRNSNIRLHGFEDVDYETFNPRSGRALQQFAAFVINFIGKHSQPIF